MRPETGAPVPSVCSDVPGEVASSAGAAAMSRDRR
jgi:hypothetical protein